MTIFISHAAVDREAAEALAKALERRGQFTELEDGERGFRPLQHADVLVALWSKDTVFSPYRLQFEKRTLDAWADEGLVFIKLDHAFSPVGLRDLASIDASFEQQRDVAWAAAAKAIQDILTARRAPPAAPGVGAAASGEESLLEKAERLRRAGPSAPPASAPRKIDFEEPPELPRGGGVSWFTMLVVLALAGAGGWMIWRGAGVTLNPSDWIASVNGPAVAIPAVAVEPWHLIALGGVLLTVSIIGALLRHARREKLLREYPELGESYEAPPAPTRISNRAPAPQAAPAPAAPTALFVSYAHADASAVQPVVAVVEKGGRTVWIDKAGINPGEGWAGEIVRAIKTAKGVMVMCSAKAFESDHVKREVYLADRYKKPMLPVFIEAAEPPEDFEYFFAGVQWLKLHETPEAERPAAIAQALAGV